MTLLNVRGKLQKKNVSRYLIRWDAASKSKLQFHVKQFLKPFWIGSICYEEFPVYGTELKVDILNATYRIAVEVQGPQHNEFHYFHNGEPQNYLSSFKRDQAKFEWIKRNSFNFIEINYDEVDLLTHDFVQEKFGVNL